MKIEDLINDQVEFRNRIDLLTLDFQLIIMDYIKRLTNQPSIIDNERKISVKNNIEYCVDALQIIQKELDIDIVTDQAPSEANAIKN
jgi:hypothetical protein